MRTALSKNARNEAAIPRASATPIHADPYKLRSIGSGVMFAFTLPALVAVIGVTLPDRLEPSVPSWSIEAASLGIAPAEVFMGERAYANSCAVCHGAEGEGVRMLGKPLRDTEFVRASSDTELFRLIVRGRPPSDSLNTTGALMPPRGAQGLPDGTIRSIVSFLRTMQSEDRPVVSVEAWNLRGGDDGATASAGAAIELTDHPGYGLFVASCAACHGQGAEGVEGIGLPLTTSGFVRGQSDKELINFVKTGRPIWDENSTTGIDMPPKGGNPAITDAELQSIVDYLRALQTQAMGS